MMLSLDQGEVFTQVSEQLVLSFLLAHHSRHFPSQVAHDHDVNLCCPHPLYKLIHLQIEAQSCVKEWQT